MRYWQLRIAPVVQIGVSGGLDDLAAVAFVGRDLAPRFGPGHGKVLGGAV